MVTAESVKTKIQVLIDLSNDTTGNTNVDLTSAINALVAGFGKGGVTLPELTNPATADHILEGYEAIDASGNKIVGTHVCESGGGGGEASSPWVPFAADGVSFMDEEVPVPNENQRPISFPCVFTDTNLYRVTVNGVAYPATIIGEYMVMAGFSDFKIMVDKDYGTAAIGYRSVSAASRYTLKIEAYVGE